MIKLLMKSKDEYCNYVFENNNKTYELNINFMDIELPVVGDYIYMPENVLKEKVSLNYGLIDSIDNLNEDELVLLVNNNKKVYLQRYYG